MIVVADTTPLCHLAWIGADSVLAHLFGEVHVPEMVMAELRARGAPDVVRAWAENPPTWLKIHPQVAASKHACKTGPGSDKAYSSLLLRHPKSD